MHMAEHASQLTLDLLILLVGKAAVWMELGVELLLLGHRGGECILLSQLLLHKTDNMGM